MSERPPIYMATVTELMRSQVITRIVTILDITSLSILELFEYGLTLKDVYYAMANGVIRYDKPTKPLGSEGTGALGIPLTGDYYFNFLNSKVKLTEVGLYILDAIKDIQRVGIKSPMMPDGQTSDYGPRDASAIG
jgi:hypothetical protein